MTWLSWALLGFAALAACAPSPDATTLQATTESPAGFACITAGEVDEVDYCTRAARDFQNRAPVTASQRELTQATANEVQLVVSRLGQCPPTATTCTRTKRRPGPADAVDLTGLLAEKALTATARVASPTDPAPEGALLYAVDLGQAACLIGQATDIPVQGAWSTVVGQLPGGRCLADPAN